MQFCRFDAAYLSRLREGDPEAEEHFASYFGQLIRIKMSGRLRSPQAVEDVRQETFVRVLDLVRSDRVHQPESLGSLVNSTCNHVYYETLRKRPFEQLPGGSEAGWTNAGILERLIAAEDAELVRGALDSLSERDQRLLRAVFMDESSRDALCEELGVSRDYLRVLIHRALENFRSRFVDMGPRPSPRQPHKRTT